jgi:hypothetical protein
MEAAAVDDMIRRLLEARGGRTPRNAQVTDAEIRRLCAAAKDVFLSQPNLLELEAPIKICGKGHPSPSSTTLPGPPFPLSPPREISFVPCSILWLLLRVRSFL